MAKSRKRPAARPGMRPRLVLLGGALAVALISGGLLLDHWIVRPVAGSAPATLAIGGPFTLLDQDGKTVTDADFRGHWLLVYFGYTHCPDACPTALNDISDALEQLPAEQRSKIRTLFITVDPERDTPHAMKEYAAAFPGGNVVGLTGSPDQVKAAESAYHVYASKHADPAGDYAMDHSSIIYVMDPNGRFVANFTHETAPEQIAGKLRALVS